jgi:hypothetical protein
LESIIVFLNAKIQAEKKEAIHITEETNQVSQNVGKHFMGILLLVLGLIWSGTGFFFFTHLIFTGYGEKSGPLVWPLGIWIAGLGIGDLAGIPIFREEKGKWRRLRTILIILYFGSYLLVCWR